MHSALGREKKDYFFFLREHSFSGFFAYARSIYFILFYIFPWVGKIKGQRITSPRALLGLFLR